MLARFNQGAGARPRVTVNGFHRQLGLVGRPEAHAPRIASARGFDAKEFRILA